MLGKDLEKGLNLTIFNYYFSSIENPRAAKLIVVIYLTEWNPTSKFALNVFLDIQTSGEFYNIKFYFIDIEKELKRCKELSFV
jgi:hypothetical protein